MNRKNEGPYRRDYFRRNPSLATGHEIETGERHEVRVDEPGENSWPCLTASAAPSLVSLIPSLRSGTRSSRS